METNVMEQLDIAARRKDMAPEVYLMPTSTCPAKCKYCYLNKEKVAPIGELDWDAFFANAQAVLLSQDFSKHGAVCVTGGELLCDQFLKDPKYVENLKQLFLMVDKLIKGTKYRLSVPVGLENIGERGIEFIAWLKGAVPYCQILCAFTQEKLADKKSKEVYLRNLNILRPYITALMCIIVNKDDYRFVHESEVTKGFVINFDEPIQLHRELAYSYGDVNWKLSKEEFKWSSPHCSAHKDLIVTSKGLFTCGQVTVKPAWVPQEEWDKFCNSREYLDDGYQQVLDWYGCGTCEKRFECPGMCWISYYAQKYLFNNRKCIYK